MPSSKKKIRKLRGHVSCGHGRIGKHRKHPSGRGNAGGQHHHRTWMQRFHPGYFGKLGMRRFHVKKSLHYSKSINLERIWPLIGDDILQKTIKLKRQYEEKKLAIKSENAEKKSKVPKGDKYKAKSYPSLSAPMIDVTKFGFTTVVGKGFLPPAPLVVKAKFFTQGAVNKIKEVGGACVLTA